MSISYSDIKNYTFKKDIGEGNFGKVKLGIFNPTGEEFAIKVLNKDRIKIKMKNSIFKENQIITKFNHINVIYVFKILEDNQNFYIIMEYCKHGELFDYIVKKEKLSEEESSIFFYQLINGIEHIHSKGIAHRDLKPENLLLDENNILKIIDFGLSHEFSEEGDELLKTKCGSPSYAAPEIICCPFYDGFKVDIWCCGIILYAMICGYLPFEGDDNDILFKNILDCDPEFPDFLSDTSIDIILKILNPDPESRITINEIKKHSFYLMGKKLCNIDYDTIESSVIKRRNDIFNNSDNNIIKNNSNDKIIHEEKDNNNNYNSINNINDKDKNNLDLNNKKNNNTKKNKSIVNKVRDNYPFNVFKDKDKGIDMNIKYTKTIDTMNSKNHKILKTDLNDNNKIISRPFSSQKNKTNLNKNNNIITSNNKKIIHTDLSSDKNIKKFQKDSLFIKIFDSTKNNYLNFKKDYEKLGMKFNTNLNLNKIYGQNKKNIPKTKNKNNDNISIDKNKNNKIKIIDNNIISICNEHINNNSNNKKHQKFNLFKEAMKNSSKRKNRFNIKKALSKYEKNDKNLKTPHTTKKYSINNSNSSGKINQNKDLNIFIPNSTLYYNNINININELTINSKSSKDKKPNIISALNNNQKIKCFTKGNDFNSLLNKNKTISAKKLFSYNLNSTKNIKSNNNTINSINTKGNIYTITCSNNSKRDYIISSINTNDNINKLSSKKLKFRSKNDSKNKNYQISSKIERILSTEPKEKLKFKKNFSFDKNDKNYKNENDIKTLRLDKRCRSEKVNKSLTINMSKKNYNYNKYFKKDIKNKKNKNKYKFDINNIDEIFLHKFIEHKYKKKSNKEINQKNLKKANK